MAPYVRVCWRGQKNGATHDLVKCGAEERDGRLYMPWRDRENIRCVSHKLELHSRYYFATFESSVISLFS